MAHVQDRWYRTVRAADGSVRREPISRHARGDRWRVIWTGPDGRRRSKSFDRRKDARQYPEMKGQPRTG